VQKILNAIQEIRIDSVKRTVIMPLDEMTYEDFKSKIIELLTTNQTGLTWTVIQEKLELPQKVPNNVWVRWLEYETGLMRRKDAGDTFWYLPNKGVTYTIGYEGKSIKEFIEKLTKNKIEQLIDVREIALSRKNGFAKNALRKNLTENGIVYKHLPELGSPSLIRRKLHDEGNYNQFFADYKAYIETEIPQKSLTNLEELAHMRRTVIMCFEFDVNKCHRKIIKEYLLTKEFGVVDL
jgi:uncharacterized protein YeaO (DUF488 family)